ncbi:MAG: DUF6918 family protein [Candidatus Nanopelagicales bacterium]
MRSLAQQLLDPRTRPAFVTATVVVIEDQVKAQRGPSGLALKAAYKVVNGVRPGMVSHAVDSLLPQFVTAMEPFYDEHLRTGQALPELLSAQRSELADALLSVTDARAEHTGNKVLKGTYQRARGNAAKQLSAAAPAIGELLANATQSGTA